MDKEFLKILESKERELKDERIKIKEQYAIAKDKCEEVESELNMINREYGRVLGLIECYKLDDNDI